MDELGREYTLGTSSLNREEAPIVFANRRGETPFDANYLLLPEKGNSTRNRVGDRRSGLTPRPPLCEYPDARSSGLQSATKLQPNYVVQGGTASYRAG